MAFLVQDDAGSVAGANGYLSVEAFKAYHDDRDGDYVGVTDDEIQSAIILATDYIDSRFDRSFIGFQNTLEQRTKWPRSSAIDRDFFDHSDTIPQVLKDATAEYALRSTSGDLAPDPETDDTNRTVTRKLERIDGVVTEETEYAETGSTAIFRSYPVADAMIKRVLKSTGNTVIRN